MRWAPGRIAENLVTNTLAITLAGAIAHGAIAAETLDPPGTTLAEFFGNGPTLSVANEQPCPPAPAPCGSTHAPTCLLPCKNVSLGQDLSFDMLHAKKIFRPP